MDLWSEIAKLKGITLKTLDQNKPFDVVAVEEEAVVIKPHATGNTRVINGEEIEDAFNELMARGEITRTEIEDRFSPRNPAYVAAILAKLPGVQYDLRPIRLRYTKP